MARIYQHRASRGPSAVAELLVCYEGADEGLGDSVGRCGRLLPGQRRDCVCGQRRERTPLDPAAGTDDTSQRPRH